MSPAGQRGCGVVIGQDYPAPIVDHAQARKTTLELYSKARAGRPDAGPNR